MFISRDSDEWIDASVKVLPAKPKAGRECVVCGAVFVPQNRRVLTCGKVCSCERSREWGRVYAHEQRRSPEHRKYQREWKRERYATDPEFAKKCLKSITKRRAKVNIQKLIAATQVLVTEHLK